MLGEELVAVLFVDEVVRNCFSFDVAILPQHQAKGLGSKLVDDAIEAFEVHAENFLDSEERVLEFCVHVVNPNMKRLLERKGFEVYDTIASGTQWLMRQKKERQNPQTSCEIAFEKLLNVVQDNFEFQKQEVLDNIKYFCTQQKLSPSLGSILLRSVKDCSSMKELEDTLNLYYFNIAEINVYPLYFLVEPFGGVRFRVEHDVEFVHRFPKARFDAIKAQGLKGRESPRKMTLTREVEDAYLPKKGYVFAYKAQDVGNDIVVNYCGEFRGRASKALSFYFKPDNEWQLIVPLECVEDFELKLLSSLECDEEEDEIAHHVLARGNPAFWLDVFDL